MPDNDSKLPKFAVLLIFFDKKTSGEKYTWSPTHARDPWQPVKERLWKKDYDKKFVKEKLWKEDCEKIIVKVRLLRNDSQVKIMKERQIVKERLWNGDWKTDWEQKVEWGSLQRYRKSFLTIFPHFCGFKKNGLWTNGRTD